MKTKTYVLPLSRTFPKGHPREGEDTEFAGKALAANDGLTLEDWEAWFRDCDRLPKFNNDGRMVFNCFNWCEDRDTPKVHPTQKPVPLLRRLIEIFTDEGDVVIDPVAGSGTTLLAAAQLDRRAYGFEVNKEFYKGAQERVLKNIQKCLFI